MYSPFLSFPSDFSYYATPVTIRRSRSSGFEERCMANSLVMCILRVQCGKHKVAGLSSRQGGLNGLQVSHFSNQNDVWILTQGRLQGSGESLGVRSHLALIDNTLLVLVEKLYRIFNSHDVLFTYAVDLVYDCRQCG